MPIPKDGATIRFESTKENSFSKKIEAIPVKKNLKDKITLGNYLEDLKMLPGFLALEEWITRSYAFKNIMNAFRNDRESLEQMLFKREAFEEMFEWIRIKILERDNARKQLEEEEKIKETAEKQS